MGKVIKILLSIFSYLLLALIVLPIIGAILLYFNPVQNFLADRATMLLSRRLETEVSLGSIYFRPFNTLSLNGLYVEDLHGDTLLYVDRLDVSINNLGLLGGKIALGGVALQNGQLNLREVAPKTLNLVELLDKIRDKEREKRNSGNFRLSVGEVEIKGVDFRFERIEKNPRDGIDFKDIEVENLALRGGGISIDGDSISMSIKELSLTEKSGFELSLLSSRRFNISGTGMRFERLTLLSPGTELEFDRLDMLYDRWDDLKDFINKVRFDGVSRGRESSLDFKTIGYFAPALKQWDLRLRRLSFEIAGPISDMASEIKNAQTPGGTLITAKCRITGMPDITRTRFTADKFDLSSNGEDIRRIVTSITGKPMDGPMSVAQRLSPFHITGDFDGLFTDFNTSLEMETGGGNATAVLEMKTENGTRDFSGSVTAERLDLNKVTNNPSLGIVTAQADASGTMSGNNMNVKGNALISALGFNGYTYNDINITGTVENSLYHLFVTSDDPNLRLAARARMDNSTATPSYDASAQIFHADLRALNFNRRDSISTVAVKIDLAAAGRNIDELTGRVYLANLSYANHLVDINADMITLASDILPDNRRQVELTSPFIDAEYISPLPFGRFFALVAASFDNWVPGLRKNGGASGDSGSGFGDSPSFVRIDFRDTGKIAGALIPGLEITPGTTLKMELDDHGKDIDLSLRSDGISLNNIQAEKLSITGNSSGNSFNLSIDADRFLAGKMSFPLFRVRGDTENGVITLAASYTDAAANTSLKLGTRSRISRNEDDGRLRVRGEITPSQFTGAGGEWDISAQELDYTASRVAIKRFLIANDNQKFVADGVLSHNRSDTLNLQLDNFDISPLSRLAEKAGYQFKGMATGFANIVSGLGEGIIYAGIDLDSIRVNDVEAPDLRVSSRWDIGNKRVRASMTKRIDGDTLIRGYFRPSDKRYFARVNIPGVDLSLIDPALKGTITNTSGTGDINLTVSGQGARPAINGEIGISDLRTTVGFTNVQYMIEQARIVAKDNIFTLQPAAIRDDNGAGGTLEMTLRAATFSNLQYELRVRPDRLMVLNTTEAENEMFFGRVFASGLAVIRGDNSGVAIDVSANTEDDSNFTLALGNRSDFTRADFVQFVARNAGDDPNGTNGAGGRRTQNSARVSLALDIRPNTDLHIIFDPSTGDGIRARGNGMINLTINPSRGELGMTGDFIITEGSYSLTLEGLVTRTFSIRPGSSIKADGNPLNAILDVTAVFTTKASLEPLLDDSRFSHNVTVECELRLTQQLNAPEITFNINVPSADADLRNRIANALSTQEMMATQFVWLLAFDSFYSEGSSNDRGFSSAGMAVGSDLLASYLLDMIPTGDRVDLGLKWRPGNDVNSNEIEFSAQAGLDRQGRWLFEFDGSYAVDGQSAASRANASNWSGDFYLTWIINRSGTLRAKVFSRTIDRLYNENQGSQENGVGLYHGRDFNKLSDLLRRNRKKSENEPD